MRLTKQEHLGSKHDPKKIAGIIWGFINSHPCFDYRNIKQNKKFQTPKE